MTLNKRVFSFLAAGACGLAVGLNFSWLPDAPFVWVALAPILFIVIRARSLPSTFIFGAVFSLAFSGCAYSFFLHLSPYGWLAATLYTGLWLSLGFVGIRVLARRGPWSAVWGTAAIWTLLEILHARMPVLGFPWTLLGSAATGAPDFRQAAEWFGVWGLTFGIVAFNAFLGLLLPGIFFARMTPPSWLRDESAFPAVRRQTVAAGLSVLLLLSAVLVWGGMRRRSLEKLLERDGPVIAAVQGSVWDKLDEDGETQEQWLSKQLRLHRIAAKPLAENGVPPLFPGEQPSLICWAETMLPGALNDPANPAVPRFLAVVRESGLPAACGSDFFFPAATLAADGASGEKHNSAFLFDGQGNLLLRQAKRRLVPFGEYVPWRETLPFLEKLSSYTRDKYAPGREKCASAPIPATLPSPGEARREHPLSPTTTAAPLRIAFNLCIEDAHPDLAREAADAGADLLLNLTNDGWFGGTFESQMHLRLAGLRTVETRRPMLRVTNTGLTAYINPLGETRILLPEGAAAVGFCRINRLSPAPRTLFRLLGECGSAAVFCVAAFAAFAADERLRRRVAAE